MQDLDSWIGLLPSTLTDDQLGSPIVLESRKDDLHLDLKTLDLQPVVVMGVSLSCLKFLLKFLKNGGPGPSPFPLQTDLKF